MIRAQVGKLAGIFPFAGDVVKLRGFGLEVVELLLWTRTGGSRVEWSDRREVRWSSINSSVGDGSIFKGNALAAATHSPLA